MGTYGYTDVHFDWRAQTQCALTMRAVSADALLLRETDEVAAGGVIVNQHLSRSAERNKVLYESKQKGGQWSAWFVRFNFRLEHEAQLRLFR